jgi:hypothetical protein
MVYSFDGLMEQDRERHNRKMNEILDILFFPQSKTIIPGNGMISDFRFQIPDSRISEC